MAYKCESAWQGPLVAVSSLTFVPQKKGNMYCVMLALQNFLGKGWIDQQTGTFDTREPKSYWHSALVSLNPDHDLFLTLIVLLITIAMKTPLTKYSFFTKPNLSFNIAVSDQKKK